MKKLAILSLLFWTHATFADDAALLQAKLNAMRSMSAGFSQVVKAEKRQVSKSSGTMALFRPGRFRWDTKSPMAQLVVADGKKLWVYDVELEQVTVKKQAKSLGGTAGLFLSGYDDTVARDFNVTVTNHGKNQLFDLRSKSAKANFQRVQLSFTNESLTSIVMFDQLGQKTEVSFKNIKVNPKLTDTLFKFSPPKGVDVVQQ